MSKRVFVTGGAGFIGSHLVDNCLNDGHEVMVYDNFSSGYKSFLPEHPSLSITTGNLLNKDLLISSIKEFNPDIVYHLAAIHFIPACENDPVFALRTNVEGTQNVLEAVRNRNCRTIFTSTGGIYDPENDALLSEDSPVATKDIYGLTKNTAEHLIEYHLRKEFGEVVIVRMFNAVGRRETNPHLIPAILEQIGGGDLRVELGNLYPRRDYVHVQDAADGLYALGMAEKVPSRVYNIASGVEHSVDQVIGLIAEAIGKSLEVVQVKERMRKYDRPSQLADLARIGNEIGWQPKRTLKTAIAEAWQECLINKTVSN